MLEDRLTPASFVVNSLLDTAPPSPPGMPPLLLVLRDAIAAANANGDASNSITFSDMLNGGITLETALPAISKNLSINGDTTALGDVNVHLFRSDAQGIPNFRIFTVAADVTFNLSNFGVFNGSETNGGGISVSAGATANLYNATVTSNNASGNGGGSWNEGLLTVENSFISANTAENNGGGIANTGIAYVQWQTKIYNQNLADGLGGGIANLDSGQFTVTDALIESNQAGISGGGIFNGTDATLEIYDSDIRWNRAGFSGTGFGGGIANYGQLDITGGWLRWNRTNGDDGGGIACGGDGFVLLTNVDIHGNSANNALGTGTGGGFAVLAGSSLYLDDCELADNHADVAASNGGHIFAGGTFDELFSEILDDIQDDN